MRVGTIGRQGGIGIVGNVGGMLDFGRKDRERRNEIRERWGGREQRTCIESGGGRTLDAIKTGGN